MRLTINKRLHERAKKQTEPQAYDEEPVFGKMVVNELRSVPKRRMKRMLKHEINESIFKY